jgi:outer membrane protein
MRVHGAGICGSLAVALLTAHVAAAQEAPVRLTLDEALARGVAASHRLAALGARVEASDARVKGAAATDRPRLSAQVGYTRYSHVVPYGFTQPDGSTQVVFPDIPNTYRTRLGFAWPIYSWGRSDALERAARAEADAAGGERDSARADLQLEITRAYWALVTARDTVGVLEEALRVADAHLADVRNRRSVGLVPPNDVLSAEAQRAREEVQLIEARNRADASAADLGRLVGIAPDTPIELDATLSPATLPTEPDPALVEEARAARPDRAALNDRIAAAAASQTAAAAAEKPQIAVGGGFDYNRPNLHQVPPTAQWLTSWDLGVTVSWVFWDGGRTGAQVAEAAANEHAAREQLLDFDTSLAADVRQRRLDLASSLAAITAAEAGVRAAAEAHRVVTDRYKQGVATNTEVLDAQVALVEAELDRTRALANSRLAEARLNRAVGR